MPLVLIVVIIIFLIIASTSGSNPVRSSSIFDKVNILDDDNVRYIAVLCKTPQTPEFLKQKYQEFRQRHGIRYGYSFKDCVKELEDRELLMFQDGKWTVTQEALDYIVKYHG
jgi:hypothetical protein